ncbi:MAG TPA: tetratricopeptide repeat protein [Geopsychrobacteraceae bacterium]|nr:tetratricopeptide repeat protein [Geopsychrobacteraceae bacterium]
MNIDRIFYCLQFFSTLFLFMILTGCLPGQNSLATVSPAKLDTEYISEISLPEAKATFAYTQYRLLVSEGRWDEALEALERAVAIDGDSRYLQMGLAKVYLHTKRLEQAIQVLRKLLQQYPAYADGHELIGDLLLHQSQPREAAEHYRQALDLKGQLDSLHLKLAMALARQGNLSAAIEVTRILLQENPDSLSARLTLARFYKENKQYGEAVAVYRALLDEKTGQVQILLELGGLLQELGLTDEALQLYQSGIEENPQAVTIHEQMARLLVSEERYREALQLLQQLNDLLPDNPQIIGQIGLLQLEMTRWAEAELTFRKLRRLSPDNDQSRYYLGMALSGSGNYQGALLELESIKSDSSLHLEAVTQQAYIYQQLEQPQTAIELLQDQIRNGLHDPIIYSYLSSSLAAVNQLPDAERVLREGLELNPDDVNLHYQLGVILEKMERRDNARREMERVLEIAPDHADALNYLAYLKAERGENLEQALIEAKRALVNKETSYILDTLGWIYFKLGRYDEGRNPLEKASRMEPDDVVILEHLGDLYRALSLWSEAAEIYRQILVLDPMAEKVKEKLDALPGGQTP